MINKYEAKKNYENEIDKVISIALMSSFIVLTFQYLILISFNLLGTTSASIVQTASKVIVGIIFIIALPHVLKRSLKLFIIVYGLTMVILGYNFLVFPENHLYLTNLVFQLLFIVLPSLIYIISIKDLMIFKEVTEKSAYIIFVFGTIIGVLIYTGNASAGAYSMSLSYYMLLPALVFLGKVFDKGKFVSIAYFLISMIVIVALGSRGALLCIGVYTCLRFVSLKQKYSLSKIFIYSLVITAFIPIVLNYQKILLFINHVFLEAGIQSRTIILLMRNEIHLSGRDTLYNTALEALRYRPFIGYGIGGDQYLLKGSYVHNVFFEILMNFGIILGMIVILFLIFMIFISLIQSELANYNILVLWLSIGFTHLFVSGSYLTDIKFWILIGILFKLFPLTFKAKSKVVQNGY